MANNEANQYISERTVHEKRWKTYMLMMLLPAIVCCGGRGLSWLVHELLKASSG